MAGSFLLVLSDLHIPLEKNDVSIIAWRLFGDYPASQPTASFSSKRKTNERWLIRAGHGRLKRNREANDLTRPEGGQRRDNLDKTVNEDLIEIPVIKAISSRTQVTWRPLQSLTLFSFQLLYPIFFCYLLFYRINMVYVEMFRIRLRGRRPHLVLAARTRSPLLFTIPE